MRYSLTDEIPGWFYKEDWDIFTHLLSLGGGGDLLEVGCYLGKSAVLMGYGLRPGETMVCCDLWGENAGEGLTGDEPEIFEALTLKGFLGNWDSYHDWRPVIQRCSSLNLDLDGLTLRFSHIDGCHQFDYAAHDIRLAVSKTIPGGVVVVDDWSAEHLPGVASAVWGAESAGLLYPFLVTPHKMYAGVTPAGQKHWYEAMLQIFRDENWVAESHKFPGYDLLVVRRDGTQVTL